MPSAKLTPWLGRAGHHPITPNRNRRRRGLKLGHDPARRAAATRQRIKTAIACCPLGQRFRSGRNRCLPDSSAPAPPDRWRRSSDGDPVWQVTRVFPRLRGLGEATPWLRRRRRLNQIEFAGAGPISARIRRRSRRRLAQRLGGLRTRRRVALLCVGRCRIRENTCSWSRFVAVLSTATGAIFLNYAHTRSLGRHKPPFVSGLVAAATHVSINSMLSTVSLTLRY
jgi:hypothetical protein